VKTDYEMLALRVGSYRRTLTLSPEDLNKSAMRGEFSTGSSGERWIGHWELPPANVGLGTGIGHWDVRRSLVSTKWTIADQADAKRMPSGSAG
jgi:hypothetical protein